jgi:hypothetical protein
MRGLRFMALMALFITGCNGGGGSDSDGVVFEGTLTERGGTHAMQEMVIAKHSAGQQLEEVKVCILGECSLTDGMGQWGVQVSGFTGGDIAISVVGHGIDTSVVANVPASARTVTLELDHNGNVVSVAKMTIDGVDHTGHTSEHDHSTM